MSLSLSVRILFVSTVVVSGQVFEGLKNLVSGSAQGAPAVVDPYEEMDLLCMKSPHAQAWLNVQQKLQYILGPSAAFVALNKVNTLEPALQSIGDDIATIPKEQEASCGVGQVMYQLLKIVTVDSDGLLIGEIKKQDHLSSPIMTLLLDIPWNVYQPMWPLFGLLAQAAVQRASTHANHEMLDGLAHPELKQFASAMNIAISESNLEGLQQLSKAYIDSGVDAMEQSPMGFLTAVFTQAATAQKREDSQAFFSDAQVLMKKMIFSASDLEATLGSQWPLWGMAYLASLKAA
eukprot:TRINITY_DN64151_c0_g1_i1.p1 TRINITY_DN64151_c0_g1~~TRINITY_DN64151_c0_g1_i1.p1  ORF type:complete len:291 (-),score=86.22 TRINITY_DN64151_c0_g1_i1:153-1025(-)